MINPKPILFWDLDGVIVDSHQAAFALMQRISPMNMSWEQYQKMSEANVWHSLLKFLSFTKKVKQEFLENQYEMIQDDPASWGAVYRGIPEVLSQTAEKYENIIITNNQARVTEPILEFYGLRGFFGQVLGREHRGNKEDKILEVLGNTLQKPEDTFFITDSLGDLREGAAAKVKTIAVTWGVHDQKTLEEGNPTHLCGSPEHLGPILFN